MPNGLTIAFAIEKSLVGPHYLTVKRLSGLGTVHPSTGSGSLLKSYQYRHE